MCRYPGNIKLVKINTLISAMYQEFYLSFVLIVVTITGNGMAKFLLVNVPEEKGITDKAAGKWKLNQKAVNCKLDALKLWEYICLNEHVK